MKTKIGFLRDEFLRIGCISPLDPFAPRLTVGWYYAKIVVRGKCFEIFDFDMLREVLKDIPDSAGEDFFWNRVRATDFNALANRLNQEMTAALMLENATKTNPTR
jgi:hypothetical protein